MAYLATKFENTFDIGRRFLEKYISKDIDYQKWLALLGASYLSFKALKYLHFFYKNFLRPRRDLLTRYGEGSWVMVVGASGGLGRAFCEAFADAGFNIILVGRNKAKLELVAQFVRSRNGKTETRIIVSDLREAIRGPEFADEIIRQLEDLDVAVLVNSVAVQDNDFFHNRTDKSLVEEVSVNYVGPTFITKKIIPRFLARPKRSAIINVSAQSGIRVTPYTVPYSCSTAFLDFLTRKVEEEIREKVDVMSVTPYVLKTNMMFNQGYTEDAIEPGQCVRAVINQLGYETRTHGHWRHQLFASTFDSMSESARAGLFRHTGPGYILWRKEQAEKSINQLSVEDN